MNLIRFASLSLVCALFAADERSIARLLDGKEERLEELYADYWRTDYKLARGDTGASTLPVRRAIRAIVSDSAFQRNLRSADLTDATLRRRRELFLEEAARVEIANDPLLAKLVESITAEENRMRFRVGDLQMSRAELDNALQSADRDLRRAAWLARAQLAARTGDMVVRAMRRRNALAREQSDQSYAEVTLARKGLARNRLLEWFEEIRSGSEDEYRTLLERMRGELKVTKIEPWDLEYYFSTVSTGIENRAFAAETAWPKISGIARSFGYDVDRLPVRLEVADISFGGATYPIRYGREVALLVNRHSGLRFVDTLMHEFGHALHYSFVQEPSYLLRANYSEAFDEGLGQVMALMLYRREIAVTAFGLTNEQADALRERYRLRSLMDMREHIAESLFEFAAYDNPGQDLARLYNSYCSKYLGVDMHDAAVWTFDPFFGTEPMYLQNYVVAEMFGRQVHRALERRFGERWGHEVGAFLRERLFSVGASRSLDAIVKDATGEPLNSHNLIASFAKQR